MTDPVQPNFPTPPTSNVVAPPPAQPTMDSILAQSLLDDLPATPQISSPNKEMAPPVSQQEVTHLVEVSEHEPMPPEVEGWLQKLDTAGDITLPEPISHDGDILLANSEAQIIKEKIVLPLSQTGIKQGLTAKVSESARWLAEWCARLIKTMKGEVKYAPEHVHGQT